MRNKLQPLFSEWTTDSDSSDLTERLDYWTSTTTLNFVRMDKDELQYTILKSYLFACEFDITSEAFTSNSEWVSMDIK